jgi:hypothetical protein
MGATGRNAGRGSESFEAVRSGRPLDTNVTADDQAAGRRLGAASVPPGVLLIGVALVVRFWCLAMTAGLPAAVALVPITEKRQPVR